MGQRLNIEIVNGETSLANCYYHWSAYTGSALRITKQIIDAYYDSEAIISLKMAVELLESTGGGVNESERAEIQKQSDKFGHIKFKDCTSRNEGLISVTENGKEETRKWEEGRVTIDLDSETFCFDVFWDDTAEGYAELDDSFSESDFESLPECPYDLCKVPFEEIDDLIHFVENNRCARDDDMVLYWVA